MSNLQELSLHTKVRLLSLLLKCHRAVCNSVFSTHTFQVINELFQFGHCPLCKLCTSLSLGDAEGVGGRQNKTPSLTWSKLVYYCRN